MGLRQRFMKHAREHNWVAVGVELVVVVLGIYLGMQANDWSQDRSNRQHEKRYLSQLDKDVSVAEQMAERLVERKIRALALGKEAMGVIFDQSNTVTELEPDQCVGILLTQFYGITVTNFPSLEEMIGSGRMYMLRDAELRSSLISYQQVVSGLQALVQANTVNHIRLTEKYPDLINLSPYEEPDTGEVRLGVTCDLAAMRESPEFLNDVAVALDQYDAFIRDGLRPWDEQLKVVRMQLLPELESAQNRGELDEVADRSQGLEQDEKTGGR